MPNVSPIEAFKSTIKGVAQLNRYKVSFSKPFFANYFAKDDYHYLFKEITLPGQVFSESTMEITGRKFTTASGIESFGKVSATLTCDSEFRIRNACEDWMNLVVDKNDTVVDFFDNYSCDIIIDVLDKRLEPAKRVILYGSYIGEMGDVTLAYGENDVAFEFTVGFVYQRWFDASDQI